VSDDPLGEEAAALAVAWPGAKRLAVAGRALILLPGMGMTGDWAPASIDGLVIADGWPQNRPQLLIDAAVTRSGQAPANFSPQYLADRAWYGYSFNAPWDPAHPQLVPAVRAWLRRFDGRP
jgi:hypothetical protein